MSKELEVLIPAYKRDAALAMCLTSLLAQTHRTFGVVVADQTEDRDLSQMQEFQTLARAHALYGREVRYLKNLPRLGMAQQRQFLLEQSRARYVLYVDDDLLLESPVIGRMLTVLRAEGCGFVGCAPIGLSFWHDERPHEQHIELWEGPVRPEPFTWEAIPWERHKAHNAANPLHLQRRYSGQGIVRYKVAWVGACVMYDRAKLLDVGGYQFWRELPPQHCGEDVMVQQLLLRRYGGCGILPSDVYHVEVETQVPDRRFNTNPLLERAIRAEQTPLPNSRLPTANRRLTEDRGPNTEQPSAGVVGSRRSAAARRVRRPGS